MGKSLSSHSLDEFAKSDFSRKKSDLIPSLQTILFGWEKGIFSDGDFVELQHHYLAEMNNLSGKIARIKANEKLHTINRSQ